MAELHNVNYFTQIKILVQNLPQKRVNCDWFVFATKCVRTWFVCSCFNLKACFFQLQIHSISVKCVWGKVIPMKSAVFMKRQRQKLVCNSQRVYPSSSNISPHLLCIWVKSAEVWGKITPMKWIVFTKLYPMSKARMLLSKILPQTSKKFTQIYLPYLWHYATLVLELYILINQGWI